MRNSNKFITALASASLMLAAPSVGFAGFFSTIGSGFDSVVNTTLGISSTSSTSSGGGSTIDTSGLAQESTQANLAKDSSVKEVSSKIDNVAKQTQLDIVVDNTGEAKVEAVLTNETLEEILALLKGMADNPPPTAETDKIASGYEEIYKQEVEAAPIVSEATNAFSDQFQNHNPAAAKIDPANASASVATVFDNDIIESSDQSAAQDFLKLLSGYSLPVPEPATGDGSAVPNNRYNTMVAAQALNAYNMSALYASRVDEGGNSVKSKLKEIYKTVVSDPQWINEINDDDTTQMELSRKSIYLMTGIFSTLYQIQENQEKLIAALTANNTLSILSGQALMEMQPDPDAAGKAVTSGQEKVLGN